MKRRSAVEVEFKLKDFKNVGPEDGEQKNEQKNAKMIKSGIKPQLVLRGGV